MLVVERHHVLLKSPATEEQLFAVIARPYFVSLIDADTRAWLTKLTADAEPITITERIVACRDPTNDKFLELAINGHAELLSATPICSRSTHSDKSLSSRLPISYRASHDSRPCSPDLS